MLKFTMLEEVKTNPKVLELFTDKIEVIIEGSINGINKTNIKTIMPTIYKVTNNKEMFYIYEYKGEFKDNKNFYVPSIDKTLNFKELKDFSLDQNKKAI